MFHFHLIHFISCSHQLWLYNLIMIIQFIFYSKPGDNKYDDSRLYWESSFKNYILITLDSDPNFQHFKNSVSYWLLLYIISWFVGMKWIISEINQPNEYDVYLILILKQVLRVFLDREILLKSKLSV